MHFNKVVLHFNEWNKYIWSPINKQDFWLPGVFYTGKVKGSAPNLSLSLGLGIIYFFRYWRQIDTFKRVPVPEPILIQIKNYQLIIGLAISTKHVGPVSHIGLRLNQD